MELVVGECTVKGTSDKIKEHFTPMLLITLECPKDKLVERLDEIT